MNAPHENPPSSPQRWQVVVVGAGAAGLVAAERSATRGLHTLLLEKNPRPGVKILMSGGTRCNLTQATDSRGIVAAFGPSGRFLHSSLAQLSPQDLVALVEAEGVATKVESTGKIFPVSNRATDVLAAFMARLRRTSCQVALDEPLLDVERAADAFILTTSRRTIAAEKLVITTGGQSYPRSGTSGDAYHWAEKLGHTIVPPSPALTPITCELDWVRQLKGITIEDASLTLVHAESDSPKAKPIDRRRGSLLFTHFGLSGPVVLDISRAVSAAPNPRHLALVCDFLPDLTDAQLEQQLRDAAANTGKRPLVTVLSDMLPRRLIEALLANASIAADIRVAELSKAARSALAQQLKRTRLPISGTLGYSKAEVTAGGVPLAEVDSRTMQSKLVPHLYWAGEVLDLDGPIGGYNFQAAFSTGWLAGLNV